MTSRSLRLPERPFCAVGSGLMPARPLPSWRMDRSRGMASFGNAEMARRSDHSSPTAREADLLFQALAAHAKGSVVVLDLAEPNQAAVQLATRYGLSPVFETARMYRGPRPDLPLSRTYGISTFELG